ncbi:MAG: ABC transporter ATP-binding protein [Deltaproteobacteria bacterium]
MAFFKEKSRRKDQVSASPPPDAAEAEEAEGAQEAEEAEEADTAELRSPAEPSSPAVVDSPEPVPSRGVRRGARTVPPKAGAKPGHGPAPVVPLIEVKHLRRAYGSVLAVKDVSFSVGRGEVVGFLGPNGAGKSTTLRMIVGYLGPSAGYVRVNGFDVVEQPLRARQAIGYMPETAPLYPEMRVREYLTFRARLKQLEGKQIPKQVELALQKVEVGSVARSLIGGLSRGFRQRVALADALLGNPPLLILDEPTAGLDPNQIHGVRNLIRELGSEHTVLLSTHILSEVEATCNRCLVIDRGVLVAQGPIGMLRKQLGGQRAVLTVQDRRRRAFGLVMGASHVIGVTPIVATSSLLPPRPGDTELISEMVRFSSIPPSGSEDGVVSLLVTFAPEVDAYDCLEQIVTELVGSEIRVREARLKETTLEEVFIKLTGGVDAS